MFRVIKENYRDEVLSKYLNTEKHLNTSNIALTHEKKGLHGSKLSVSRLTVHIKLRHLIN